MNVVNKGYFQDRDGTDMNVIDMVIVAIVCVCMIRGVFRGLSSELASIMGVVSGFYGAYLFYPGLAALLPERLPAGSFTDLIAFAAVFCLVLLLVDLLGRLIRFALGITMMGWLDRLLGAGFGAVKGALVAAVVLFMATHFYQSSVPVVRESMLSGYVTAASDTMAEAVSSRWHQRLKSRIMELRKNWNHREK